MSEVHVYSYRWSDVARNLLDFDSGLCLLTRVILFWILLLKGQANYFYYMLLRRSRMDEGHKAWQKSFYHVKLNLSETHDHKTLCLRPIARYQGYHVIARNYHFSSGWPTNYVPSASDK